MTDEINLVKAIKDAIAPYAKTIETLTQRIENGGDVTVEQFAYALKRAGERMTDAFDAIDGLIDGQLDKGAFLDAMAALAESVPEQEFAETMKELGLAGSLNGRSPKDVIADMRASGEFNKGDVISFAEAGFGEAEKAGIDTFVEEADKDGDGKINLAELKGMKEAMAGFMKAQIGGDGADVNAPSGNMIGGSDVGKTVQR